MRTLAVINQKGGSGKTTSTVNLAAALGVLGKRALVIDMDPQGGAAGASAWLGVSDGGRGLLEVLTDGKSLAALVTSTPAESVELVPSSTWLANADRVLAGEVGAELVFRKALARLPSDRWDFVFVDCPPTLGLLVISALAACSEVLIPVEARAMPLGGVASLMTTIATVRERLNPEIVLAGFLACRCDGRLRLSEEVIATLRERFGKDVFQTVIRENVRLAEAWGHRKPINLYDARSAGAEDYAEAARELVARGAKRVQRTKRVH